MPKITIEISNEAAERIKRLLDGPVFDKHDFDNLCTYILLSALKQIEELHKMQKASDETTRKSEP